MNDKTQRKLATIVRHTTLEDDGTLRSVLLANRYRVEVVDAPTTDLKAAYRRSDLVLVTGAPIGAYETDLFPFLRREIDEVSECLRLDKPIFGIGLGAHLIARALGARVYPGRRCELGWLALSLTAAGKHSPIAALENVPVLHWHEDTFDLPQGADLLASTPAYEAQAFAWGKHALGVQFHAEASASTVEQWLISYRAQLRSVGADVRALRHTTAQLAPAAEHAGMRMLASWLDASCQNPRTAPQTLLAERA